MVISVYLLLGQELDKQNRIVLQIPKNLQTSLPFNSVLSLLYISESVISLIILYVI